VLERFGAGSVDGSMAKCVGSEVGQLSRHLPQKMNSIVKIFIFVTLRDSIDVNNSERLLSSRRRCLT
jgi:hypothetical protein